VVARATGSDRQRGTGAGQENCSSAPEAQSQPWGRPAPHRSHCLQLPNVRRQLPSLAAGQLASLRG